MLQAFEMILSGNFLDAKNAVSSAKSADSPFSSSGKSKRNKLKRAGEANPPCITPASISRSEESVFLYLT